MKKFIFIILVYSHCVYAQVNFSEVATQKGMNYIYPGGDNQEVGSGVTVLDVNNDGWDDFFQASGIFITKLWVNHSGVFVDETEKYFSDALDKLFVQAAVSGDFDNDGFTDLFVCNYGTGASLGDDKLPILFKNINGEYFKPVFRDVFNQKGNYTSATWGDYNNDGYIDLFVTNYIEEMREKIYPPENIRGYDPTCQENRFYINLQGQGFAEVSKKYDLQNDGCGLACAFTDYDQDGDVDIMLLNDFGEWNHKGNQLYRNDFPKDGFTNVSKSSGFYDEFYGMGVGPGDYDNDGDLDYYITNIGENKLFQNDTAFRFTNISKALNIDNTWVKDSLKGTGWSGIFFDADLDGDLDLYVTQGNVRTMTPNTAVKDPNKLFLNMGNGKFKDVSIRAGIDDVLSHRGSACLDFNHDGKLDLISSVIKMTWADFGGMDQRLKLFQNNTKTKSNWIGIKLVGEDSINRDALGSRVVIQSGKLKQVREVDGGTGHGSQSSKTLYFGIKKEKMVETITIYWVGGKKQTLKNLKPGHAYEIRPSGKISTVY